MGLAPVSVVSIPNIEIPFLACSGKKTVDVQLSAFGGGRISTSLSQICLSKHVANEYEYQ